MQTQTSKLKKKEIFSFYKKELIDLLPNNRFNMYETGGLGIVNRVGKTNSVGHNGISAWNTHAGTFRDFLYDNDLVPNMRWFSDMKRVSKYCIEGERGFVSNNRAGESGYEKNVEKNLGLKVLKKTLFRNKTN